MTRVAPHVIEGARRRIGICECRNPRGVQDRLALGDRWPTHPACQHWLAAPLCIRGQAPGDLRGIRHYLGSEGHTEPIAARYGHGDIDGFYYVRSTRHPVTPEG